MPLSITPQSLESTRPQLAQEFEGLVDGWFLIAKESLLREAQVLMRRWEAEIVQAFRGCPCEEKAANNSVFLNLPTQKPPCAPQWHPLQEAVNDSVPAVADLPASLEQQYKCPNTISLGEDILVNNASHVPPQPSEASSPIADFDEDTYRDSLSSPIIDILRKTYIETVCSDEDNEQTIKVWSNFVRAILNNNENNQFGIVRPVWLIGQMCDDIADASLCDLGASRSVFDFMSSDASHRTGDVWKYDQCWLRYLVRHPDHLFSTVYACIVAAVLLYDVVCFPFILVFEIDKKPFWYTFRTIAWATTSFWTFDMLMSCFAGFHTAQGIVEMRVHIIALRYLKSWFIFDCIVNVIDWISCTSMINNGKETGALQFSKGLRVLRLLRLVRVLHSVQVLEVELEGLFSEYMILLGRLLRLLSLILFISHYISCGWCALALHNKDGTSWIQAQGLEGREMSVQYIASLHWSFTQFTPATNNIAPANSQERLFATFVVLFGLIMFSTFVSNLTGNVLELKRMRNSRTAEIAQIKRYMRSKRVPLVVYRQVWAYYNQHYRIRQRVPHEVPSAFFTQLPTSLRKVFRISVHLPIICQLPVFERGCDIDKEVFGFICDKAVHERFIASAQDYFCTGDPAPSMIYQESGTLYYTYNICPKGRVVTPPHAIAEATLWTRWVHRGVLTARTACVILEVNSAEFEKVFRTRGPARELMDALRKYAAQYAQRIGDNDKEPVTDLMLPSEELSNLADTAFAKKRGSFRPRGSVRRHSAHANVFKIVQRAFSGHKLLFD